MKQLWAFVSIFALALISCHKQQPEGEFTVLARSAADPGLAPANVRAVVKSNPHDTGSKKTIEFEPAVYLGYQEGDGEISDLEFQSLAEKLADVVLKVRISGSDVRITMVGQKAGLRELKAMSPWLATHVWEILEEDPTIQKPPDAKKRGVLCARLAGSAKKNTVDAIEMWIEGPDSPYAVAFRHD